MERNVTQSTNSKTTSRSPKTKQALKKIQTDDVRKSDCTKIVALQEALQDPITVYEGN